MDGLAQDRDGWRALVGTVRNAVLGHAGSK